MAWEAATGSISLKLTRTNGTTQTKTFSGLLGEDLNNLTNEMMVTFGTAYAAMTVNRPDIIYSSAKGDTISISG